MPRTPFDQFAKALVIEHLSPYGTTVAEYEVSSEPQYADLWWSPDAQRLPKRPRVASWRGACMVAPGATSALSLILISEPTRPY